MEAIWGSLLGFNHTYILAIKLIQERQTLKKQFSVEREREERNVVNTGTESFFVEGEQGSHQPPPFFSFYKITNPTPLIPVKTGIG